MIINVTSKAETLGVGEVNVKFPTWPWDKRQACARSLCADCDHQLIEVGHEQADSIVILIATQLW